MAAHPVQTSIKGIVCLCAVAAGLLTVPARAADDPFQLDGAQWMSFDHYKDASQRGVLTASKPAEPEPVPAAAAPTPKTAAAGETAKPAAPSALATPARPLNLPVMPALGSGYAIQVSSTEDSAPQIMPVDTASADQDGPKVADQNWQQPASVVMHAAKSTADNGETAPLAVRMSYLPDRSIAPLPSREPVSAQHQAHLALEKGMMSQKPPKDGDKKSPADLAACAAIDAYKKQQLSSIQSDRQTLKALQDAITALGLQKQLNFMTDANGSLDASASADSGATASPRSIQ